MFSLTRQQALHRVYTTPSPCLYVSAHRSLVTDLKATLKSVIPARRERFLKVKKELSGKTFGDEKTSIGSILGGMRSQKSLYWESSMIDMDKGILFHGKTIEECQAELPQIPSISGSSEINEMVPEAMFWFLLTGKIPTQDQITGLSRELAELGELPDYVKKTLDNLPATLHPMSQLSIAITLLNNESKFARAYEKGIPKAEYWEHVYDDTINLIAKLPQIAAKIYHNTYKLNRINGDKLDYSLPGKIDLTKDLSYNYANMLGMTQESANINGLTEVQSQDFVNLLRLYIALHGDHEGGNVSAHSTHLVGSSLADPYLSYSAGIQGLAGPLHGLAAQEVVRFVLEMNEALTKENNGSTQYTNKQIKSYLWNHLNSGRVIPGYGHAVLRKADPRFDAMMAFAAARPTIKEQDPTFNLVVKLSEIVPDILKEHGKTKNPYPNVDSSSGVLFHHYGIKETLYYTVIFGVSRALGPLSQLIWDRILGLPIERPKSVNLDTIIKNAK
ncbi:methylcitrate synthase precursor [Nadsonia fulvescens var. elongata DSM 6958]|uniref:Citrate synthase n=1 Tax=Nadsonia fulvescens var. elongata DSM 6958 TaxID=857566 RepID=A0A1E3PFJ1_9ASCO|nr:methylcitrate synthase precursor [Nadsonia fulvescens var. elongata DSM 6958]